MACPVNHPLFHALVFLIGILVVLSRYVRAEGDLPPHSILGLASSRVDLVGEDWVETVLSLTGGVGAGLLLMTRRRSGKGRSVGERSSMSQRLVWHHEASMPRATGVLSHITQA